MIPVLTRKQIEKRLTAYCKAKAPSDLKDKIRVGFKVRLNSVTLYEERPAFGKSGTWVSIVVAQFRFNPSSREWTLYCADRNSKWQIYSEADPNKNFKALLREVDEDPTGIFWG